IRSEPPRATRAARPTPPIGSPGPVSTQCSGNPATADAAMELIKKRLTVTGQLDEAVRVVALACGATPAVANHHKHVARRAIARQRTPSEKADGLPPILTEAYMDQLLAASLWWIGTVADHNEGAIRDYAPALESSSLEEAPALFCSSLLDLATGTSTHVNRRRQMWRQQELLDKTRLLEV